MISHMHLLLSLIFLVLLFAGLPDGKSDPYKACLPEGFELNEVVSGSTENTAQAKGEKLTIKRALQQMKARCRRGKLVDGAGKEIYFFRLIGCWGNPPEDYEDQLKRQAEKLSELKKKYRVIEIACNSNPP
jgi:hypothetical protein